MSNLLITGGSGFLGSALIDKLLAKGERVISVSRHPPELKENMVPLVGDILKPNLGIGSSILNYGKITACYHLAGIVKLGEDKDGSIWKTNVEGTKNVIDFCSRCQIPHLFFCSSAYTQGRNPYEKSKQVGELLVAHSDIPSVTIFKPSILMPMPQGNFSLWVSLLVKVHRRAEIVRRKLEGTLRLPVIEPVFRIKGNPEGKINLVSVESVAKSMSTIEDEGIYWLTNPHPPTLKEILEWIGEFVMVKLPIVPEFKPTPIELTFQRIARAFEPYLQGDDFPSHLHTCPKITREFIYDTIKKSL